MKYARMIDARWSGKVSQNTTQILSAPEYISTGQAWSAEDLTTYLTRIGYRPEADENSLGQYTAQGNTVDIRPSKLSYFGGSNALPGQVSGRAIRSIRPLSGGGRFGTAQLEPDLIPKPVDRGPPKPLPLVH